MNIISLYFLQSFAKKEKKRTLQEFPTVGESIVKPHEVITKVIVDVCNNKTFYEKHVTTVRVFLFCVFFL